MKAVAIVDTSIFCNVLNIPNMNSERHQVMKDFDKFIQEDTSFLLPMAVIYETGNHIAQLSDGGHRHIFAKLFTKQVRKAINGEAPWQVMQLPNMEEVGEWLSDFPEKVKEGAGIADLSIIKEWDKMVKKIPSCRIFIWSLDRHLQGYDHSPRV